MLSAQSQRSCRYVLDFTSLSVFSNLRSLFLFFLTEINFYLAFMQWYHKNGSLCFNWAAIYHAYRGLLREHDQSRNTCLVFSKSVQHIYSLLWELFFLNLQQSTNLNRFCYLNNMNYFYIFSGPFKEVDFIKFQITISVCFKLDWENNGCYYTSIW